MGANLIIAAGPNHLGTRFSEWVAKSEYSGSFQASNLAHQAPSKRWQSTNHNPWKTSFYGYHNVGMPYFTGSFLDTLVLVGHNLRPGTGRWRVRLFDAGVGSDPTGLPSWIKPNGTPASSNVTGSHLDVDDDPTGALDGNAVVPTTTTSAWSITLEFESPALDLVVGSSSDRRCAFVLAVALAGLSLDAEPAQDVPTVKVELLEGTTVIRDLGTKPVYLLGGQYLVFPWDALELSSPAATDLRIRVNGSPGGIGGYAKLNMVAGWAELVGWDSTDVQHDSGWLAAVDDLQASSVFGSFYPTRSPRRETSLHRLATPLGAKTKFVQFLLMDDHLPAAEEINTATVAGTWSAAEGYLYAGVGWASQALELTVNRELGELVTFDDRSIRRNTYGGNLGGAQYPRRRIVHAPLENLTQVEAISLVDRLAWEGSILTPAVVSVRPQDSLERRHTTIYGVLMDPQTALRAVNNNETFNRGVTLRFLEWR